MTLAAELVARLRARGAVLLPDGATLVIRPAAVVQPDEVPVLREHKAEILALLLSPDTIPPSWPAALPALGARRVIAFTGCHDCRADPPPDEILSIRRHTVAVPGQQGTFVAYGDLALCQRHATARAGRGMSA